jgi:uncharacterized protein
MTIFVDTSAFLAILDADALQHSAAKAIWESIIRRGERLVATNYVLLETFALVQNRLGLKAVQTLQLDFIPLLSIYWLDEINHAAGVAALFVINRRQVSLVDCVSFNTIRHLGLDAVFAFDNHFVEQGFTCIP